MKTIKLISLFLPVSFLLWACGDKKEKTSGEIITVRPEGITSERIWLEVNDMEETRNTFTYGEQVKMLFNNVKGFTEINRKTYPAMSLTVIKNGKDTVNHNPRLLDAFSEGTELKPLLLHASVPMVFSHDKNDKYEWILHITDRKGQGRLAARMPFTVRPAAFCKVKNRNLSYTKAYLWDETDKKVVADGKINPEHTYKFYIEGLTGLQEKNQRIFPSFSVKLLNADKDILILKPGLLTKQYPDGMEAGLLAARPFIVKIRFPKNQKQYFLTVMVRDRQSDRLLRFKMELNEI